MTLDAAIATIEARYSVSVPIQKHLRAGYFLRVMQEQKVGFEAGDVVGVDDELSKAWGVVSRKYGVRRDYPI